MAAPSVVGAAPPFPVDNIFFKHLGHLQVPVKEGDTVNNTVSQGLASSGKFGVILVASRDGILVLDVQDFIERSSQKGLELKGVKHFVVRPRGNEEPAGVISISQGEEFLCFDAVRGGVHFVLIYRVEDFLKNRGQCDTIAELRVSSKVTGIAWNPGENMGNIVALSSDDGILILATVKGKNAVEFCSYNGNVRSMCWSPKGKQLVVGKGDGSLAQLKLDCTEAKRIPGPGPGRLPTALFWSATTQFIINYVVEGRDIDLMQLDLPKGAAPVYSNFGDAFVSDKVDPSSKCFFVPVTLWNILICPTNTINDIIVLGKGLHDKSENWTLTDINDNRRAALPIDNYSIGTTPFWGHEGNVVFNESEMYQKMPVIFVLSHTGMLSAFFVINSQSNAPPVFQKVVNPLPQAVFAAGGNNQKPEVVVAQPTAAMNFGGGDSNIFGSLSQPSSFGFTTPVNNPGTSSIFGQATTTPKNDSIPAPTSGFGFSTPVAVVNLSSSKSTSVPVVPAAQQPQLQTPSANSPKQGDNGFNLQSLPTTGLPTLDQVADLKRLVEEKRVQGGLVDDEEVGEELLLDIEKFQRRLELFNKRRAEISRESIDLFNLVTKEHEEEVEAPLRILEDFVKNLKETKESQIAEINGLKERTFSHFTELEYAKALAERNRDPKYLELILSQPMDGGTLKKLNEIEKMYKYLKNQTSECERFFKAQSQQEGQGSAVLQEIYQTLNCHSQVINKLSRQINQLRMQLGLGRVLELETTRVFEMPSMGFHRNENKPLLKERPMISIPKNLIPKMKAEKTDSGKINMDDVTAGLSRMKLEKLREMELLGIEKKPIKITAQKLETLKHVVPKQVEVNVMDNEKDYIDPFDISVAANKARSRNLINKLDDSPLPKPTSNLTVGQGMPKSTTSSNISPPKPQQHQPVPSQHTTTKSVPSSTQVTPAQPQPSKGTITGGTPLSFGFATPTSAATPKPSSSLPQGFGMSTTFTPNPPSATTTKNQAPAPASTGNVTTSTIPKVASTPAIFSHPSITTTSQVFGVPIASSSVFQGMTATTAQPSSLFSALSSPSPGSGAPAFSLSSSLSGSLFGSVSTTTIIPFGSTTSTGSSKAPPQAQTQVSTAVKPSTHPEAPKYMSMPTSSEPKPTGVIHSVTPVPASTPEMKTGTGLDSMFEMGLSDLLASPSVPIGSPGSNFGLGLSKPASNLSTSAFGSILSTPKSTSAATSVLSLTSTATPPPSMGAATSLATATNTPSATSVAGNMSKPVGSVSIIPSTPTTTPTFGNVVSSSATPNPNTTVVSAPSIFGTPPGSPGTPVNTVASSAPPIFGAPTSITQIGTPNTTASASPATPAFGGTQASSTSIFGSSGTGTGIFGSTSTPASTAPISATPASTVATSTPSLFTSPQGTQAPAASAFGSSAPVVSSSSIFSPAPNQSPFGSTPTSISSAATTPFGGTSSGSGIGIFGSSASSMPVSSSGIGVFGNATISGPPSASTFSFASPAAPTASTAGNAFGSGSAPSIFGGATSQPSSVFGGSAPAPAFGGSSTFGGSSAFGSTTSPFGSSFGASSPTSSSGGSIFGGGAQQNTGSFGTITQQNTAPAASGFGSFGTSTAQSGGSVFGAPTQAAGAPIFGASPTAKPAFGSAPVFGNATPAFGGSATFGGPAAFGSGGTTSVFGSSFGATSPGVSAPSPGSGSIFGGQVVQQNAPSFGALAQTAPPPAGFGTFGGSPSSGSVFGGTPAPQQTPAFGQQQPSAPQFGGSAFSSWR